MSKRGRENSIETDAPDVDMTQLETDFISSLDQTEMSYLIQMGLFKSEPNQEEDSLESKTNLFNLVQEMNSGLESSIAATLSLFRKISLKFAQGNSQTSTSHKQEKRIQKKESQENNNNNQEEIQNANILQIVLWLESRFHRK